MNTYLSLLYTVKSLASIVFPRFTSYSRTDVLPIPTCLTQTLAIQQTDILFRYNNYEGFDLAVSGPYQEFPILHSFKDYSGGSPGADRVVFNTDGELAAVVTHTGAQGNDFLECDG